MFEISDRAARQISETCRRRRAPGGGFRIRRDAGGDPDQLKVGFTPRPEPGDHVFEKDEAHVYVAADTMDAVEGWILDLRTKEDRSTLFLRRAPSPSPG